MKTKILLLLFLTFIFTAIGQITPNLIPGDDNHTVAFSPNGNYVVVAADGDLGGSVPSGDGLLRVYQRNGDNTFSMINEFFLPKGNTVDAGVGFLNSKTTAITNTGDYYIFFEDDYISGIQQNVLMKNGIEIYDFVTTDVSSMITKDGSLYMCGNTNGITFFKKYDINTNALLWSTESTGASRKIIKTDGYNPHLVIIGSGDLVEFDDTTGANLGVVATGTIADKYQINPNGNIEHYKNNIDVLETENGETDWFVDGYSVNFFTPSPVAPDKWLTLNENAYVASGTVLYTFSKELVHGFRKTLVPASYGVDQVLDTKIYDNGDTTLITYIDGGGNAEDTIDIQHITYSSVTPATLNNSGTNVTSVYDEQRYDGSSWVSVFEHIGTIVLNGTMPNVGDLASFDWVIAPSGFSLFTAGATNPIIQEDSNGNLFVRFIFKPTASYDYQLKKTYLIHTSSLSIDDNSLDKISIFPNPVNNILTLQNAEFITEINIFNALGQKVFKFTYSDNSTEKNIDVTNLKSGIYTINVKGKIGVLNKKFIKI